jgi:molybdate transport system substrate-binding protein
MTQNPRQSFNWSTHTARRHQRSRGPARAGWLSLLGGCALWSAGLSAQSAPLRLLVSNGVKGALEAVRPTCETQIGTPFAAEFGTSSGLRAQAESGAAFDLVILTEDAVTALVGSGAVTPASRRTVARTRIGVGIRDGSHAPDVSTAPAVKSALLAAPSVTYASDGASRPWIERMFERLGIASQMAAKTHLEQGSTRAAARVVEGRTAVLITLVSEIVPVAGMRLAGALPAEFQGEVTFAAAAGARSSRPDLAAQAIACVTSASAERAYAGVGLERLPAK